MAILFSEPAADALWSDPAVGNDPFALRIPTAGAWSFSKDDPGESIKLGTTVGLDMPQYIRYAVSPVADVYKNTGATPIAGQNVNGLNILVQTAQVWKAVEDGGSITDPALYYFPISAHFVMKVPILPVTTGSVVGMILPQLVGALGVPTAGDMVEDQLEKLVRGITRIE